MSVKELIELVIDYAEMTNQLSEKDYHKDGWIDINGKRLLFKENESIEDVLERVKKLEWTDEAREASIIARQANAKGSDAKGLSIEQGIEVRDRLYERLKNEKITIIKPVEKPGQSTSVYKAKLTNGAQVIWKEKHGMNPKNLRDVTIPREVAAYEADRLLGVNLSAPVVGRTHNGKEGYLQGYAGKMSSLEMGRPSKVLPKLSNDDIAHAAMFDYITNQRDRYAVNYRITAKKAGGYKLRLIDNARAWGDESNRKIGFNLMHEAAVRKIDIPEKTKNRLRLISKETWTKRLSSHLPQEQIDASWKRLESVKKYGLKAMDKNPLAGWSSKKREELG